MTSGGRPPAGPVAADPRDLADVRLFLARARRVDPGALVRVVTVGGLAVLTVPVLTVPIPEAPGRPEDGSGAVAPAVLGVRALRVLPGPRVERVVSVAALSDRLARLGAGEAALPLPVADLSPRWSSRPVPRAGWRLVDRVPAGVVAAEAARGMAEVASALPRDAGAPVVAAVRARVWGAPWRPAGGVQADGVQAGAGGDGAAGPGESTGTAGPVPRGLVFAAVALGFVPARPRGDDLAALRTTVADGARWWRLTGPGGDAVAVSPAG